MYLRYPVTGMGDTKFDFNWFELPPGVDFVVPERELARACREAKTGEEAR